MSVPIVSYKIDIEKTKGGMPEAENIHYWKYSLDKLKHLYDLLLVGKMIAENQSFFQSFYKFSDESRVKTEWLFSQRSLFCLMYLLYGSKPTYEGENIEDICSKLFIVKGLKTNYKSTKQNFKTFLEKAEDTYYLNKKHPEILELVNKIGINK
jgi:hypothetical protein